MDSLCRLCGSDQSTDLVPIFSFIEERLLSDLIILLIPIKLEIDEELPKNICQECLEIIKTAHNLRRKSIENDTIFRSTKFQEEITIKNDLEEMSRNFVPNNIESSTNDDFQDNASSNDFIPTNNENSDNDSEWSLPLSKIQKDLSQDLQEDFKCDLCNAKFKYLNNLASHQRQFHKNPPNKFKYYIKSIDCKVCGLQIAQRQNLKRHVLQYHDTKLKYGCPQCTYRFKTIKSLRHHGIKFHNLNDIKPSTLKPVDIPYIFECDICGEKLVEKNGLKLHMTRKHLKGALKFPGRNADSKFNYQCEFCDRKFSVRSNMFRHYQTSHSHELPFQCQTCNEGFRTKLLYAKHMEIIHLIDNCTTSLNIETRVPLSLSHFVCEFCSEDLGNSKYQFERHMIIMHENELKEVYECENCSKKYIFKESYNQHVGWHERKQLEKTFEFGCDMCSKRFLNEERLEKHKNHYHASQSSLVCHICGKQMNSKGSLSLHVKRHSEKRDYPCPQCPQSFVYVRELERHMNSHTDIRKFACDVEGCNKRFNDAYIFQLHKKRHAGLLERKYHCEHCDKKFTSKYALDRHKLTHTQERPHVCEYCPMAYTQKNDLVKHLREHVGDAIYKCDFEGCGQGFRLKFELKQHYAVHYTNPS